MTKNFLPPNLALTEKFLVDARHPLSLLGQKRNVYGLPPGWDGAGPDTGDGPVGVKVWQDTTEASQ